MLHPHPAALLDVLPDPVVVVGDDVHLRWGNRAAVDRFGWTVEQMIGLDLASLVHPDDLVTALASLRTVQAKPLGTAVTIRVRDVTGRYGSFEVRGRSAVDDDRIDGVVLALRDLTDRRRWDVDGGDDTVFRVLFDHAPGITIVLSRAGTVRGASRAYTTILGRDLESTIGLPLADICEPADSPTVRHELALVAERGGTRSFEATFPRQDGRPPVPLRLTVVNLLDDGSVNGLVATAVDITDLAEARTLLRHSATHDQLTDLANRAHLRDQLDRALRRTRAAGRTLSIVFCDIDGFKAVNDTYGHGAGDEVLVTIAQRLRAARRETDVVARYGGDEFVLLLEDGEPDVALRVLDRVRFTVAQPIALSSGDVVHVRASAGIAVDSGRGDVDDLLLHADAAMYRSKVAPR